MEIGTPGTIPYTPPNALLKQMVSVKGNFTAYGQPADLLIKS